MEHCPPQTRESLAQRLKGRIDTDAFEHVTVTRLDCIRLGKMFSTEGIPGYGASVLRVVQGTALHIVMEKLLQDFGFRGALNLDADFALDALPTMPGDVPGETFIVNVPSDIVWASLAFIMNTWGSQYGLTFVTSVAQRTHDELATMLARLDFFPDDIDKILAARKEKPDGVDAVFDALFRQSALLALVVNRQSRREYVPPAPQEHAPAPDEGCSSAHAPPEPETEQDPPPRQITNEEIAEEVCALIVDRHASSGNQDIVRELCKSVRACMKEYAAKDMHIAEMDAFIQSNSMASGVAVAVVFAYTMFGKENNAYMDNIINALITAPPSEADDPAPQSDPSPTDDA